MFIKYTAILKLKCLHVNKTYLKYVIGNKNVGSTT